MTRCGTNIEAAHIVDEAAGGSNEADNGIPLCFDCHQEVGAYNDLHPRGNKFRPEELRARRNRVYDLVESGDIYRLLLNPDATEEIAFRREQIAKWRAMVVEVARRIDETHESVAVLLDRHPDFASLKPHLSPKTRSEIYDPRTWMAFSTLGAALSYLRDDIEALERRWNVG
jgi:hypothetical protein